MATKHWHCVNVGACATASAGELFEVPADGAADCPDCGRPLARAPRRARGWRTPFLLTAGAVVLLGGGAYGYFTYASQNLTDGVGEPSAPVLFMADRSAEPALADTAVAASAPAESARAALTAPASSDAGRPAPVAARSVAPAEPSPAPEPVDAAPAKRPTALLASGSSIAVALAEQACGEKLQRGELLSATLSQPVATTDGASIAAGTPVILRITGRSMSGSTVSEIRVVAYRVTVGGRVAQLQSNEGALAVKQAPRDGGRDAVKKVGVGAAAGALIGAVVGKGSLKGAATGAAVGAAAGGVAAAMSHGERCLAEGVRLTLTLSAPAVPLSE